MTAYTPAQQQIGSKAADGGAIAVSGLNERLLASRDPLLRFLRARGAGADAEDVIQELWVKIDRLDADCPIADPQAYLFRIARNLMHDHIRTAMRRTKREHGWSQIACLASGQDDAPSPERMLAARERLHRLELELATLSERSQAIFRRFRIEGIAQGRIAEEEGISVSAVQKHLQRAYRIVAAFTDENTEIASPIEA